MPITRCSSLQLFVCSTLRPSIRILLGVLLATLASFISNLGLNLQKLNHTLNEQRIRQQIREKRKAAEAAAAASEKAALREPHSDLASKILSDAETFGNTSYQNDSASPGLAPVRPPVEPTPLAVSSSSSSTGSLQTHQKPPFPSVIPPSQQQALQVQQAQSHVITAAQQANIEAYEQLNKVDYSAQKMWRMGLGLVTLGSILDFIALIFASQSLVAPLGSLTLVSNTFLAPVLLGEYVSRRDLMATGAIVLGSILAVVFADHSDSMYRMEELFAFFASERFGLYALVIILIVFGLHQWQVFLTKILLTQPRRYTLSKYARYHRFTYATLAGIMGAQSVLFAKCVGQLLVDWGSGEDIFRHVQTYLIILGLILTIFFQITWLNAGLKLFEALYIVPVFQSNFILISVIGGMIVFQEYQNVFDAPGSSIFFPLGIIITIVGVYMLSQRGGSSASSIGTPRHTPKQRDYMYYGKKATNLPSTSASSTVSPNETDEFILINEPTANSQDHPLSPSSATASSSLLDFDSSFVSPAPPIPFVAGPFIDSTPNTWHEGYRQAMTDSPVLSGASLSLPISSYTRFGRLGLTDPERAYLVHPHSQLPFQSSSQSLPNYMNRFFDPMLDSIDDNDIVDDATAQSIPMSMSIDSSSKGQAFRS